MDKNQNKPNILMRVGVIVGILIILFVITIGIIKLVPKALSSMANISVSFSSLFKPTEKLTATLSPSAIKTGESTTLSFGNTGKDLKGAYTLSYECQNGVKIIYKNGPQSIDFTCNYHYVVTPTNNSIVLIGTAPQGVASKVPLTLSFIPTASTSPTLKASVSLTISNTSGTPSASPTPTGVAPTVTPTPYPTATPRPTVTSVPQETGSADLSIRLIDQGIIDPSTNQFVSTRNYTSANTVVLKFEIENIGTKRSGAWSFRTTQPTTLSADATRSSGTLGTLLPGYSTGVVTLGISGIRPEGGMITVVANPLSTNESNYSNNTLQVQVPASINGGTNGGNADLSVAITDTGVVDRYTNQFTRTTNVRSSDKVRVRFTVKNIGGRETGAWNLSAVLPISSSGNFTSGTQNSLLPGQTADFSIDFDGLQQNYGNSNVTITIDPNNMVYETNEGNNTASTYLNVNY